MERAYRHLMAVQILLAIANATAAVFGIVFLLKRDRFPLEDLVLFSLISFAVAAALCVVLVRVRPMRSDRQMIAGLAILASSYAAFLVGSGWPLLIYVGVAWGFYIPLFFLPFNALLIGTTKPEDRAGKIGSFVFGYTAVAIVAPTLGGTIIAAAGYSVVFSLAAVVLLADAFVIHGLRLGRAPLALAFDFRSLGRRTSVAVFAEGGFEGLAFGVVPLLAYGFTTDELDLGGLFSLFALAGGAVTVVLGVVSDRLRNRRPFLVAGALLSALATLLVARAATLAEFALANSLVTLTSAVAPVFLFTIAIERSPTPGHAIVTREVLLNSGRAVSLGAYLGLVALDVPPSSAFALAAVCLALVALGNPNPRDAAAA